MAISNGYIGETAAKKFKAAGNEDRNAQNLEVKKEKLRVERQSLPIFLAKTKILSEIRKNSSTIIIGETGSGKTTQIPQFIYEQNINRTSRIYITQPRRVAAVSLSMRVAEEMDCQLGTTVGYSVRFDNLTSEDTVIQYMTDGMLLREAMHDNMLRKANVIIMDEVHERTLHTDVVMGIVKRAQMLRKAKSIDFLKIVVMSATMDVDQFSVYFNNAPVVYVDGRQHSVEIMYTAHHVTDYFHDTLVTVFQLHQMEPEDKDFLIFLTGQEEIEQAVRKIRSVVKELPPDKQRIQVFPLYSALAPHVQMRVFQPRRQGMRKIIVATNIAETSITIPGVRIVIDSGKVKSRIYEPTKCIDMLRVVNISKAQCCQRAGRAGREAPGACYRLYRESDYESFSSVIPPEILRCNLSSVLLEMLAMRINDLENFDFMDKPKKDAIDSAVRELKFLGAVDVGSKEDGSPLHLTPLGRRMASFPVDPKLSRVILAAEQLGCVEEALNLVALISCDSILCTPSVKREECEAAHRKYFAPEGDMIFQLNVFRAYKHAKGIRCKDWCQENFVNQRNAETVEKVKAQLKEICAQQNISISSCPNDNEPLRQALCHGLFLHSAELDPAKTYKIVDSGVNATIHPSSCLFQHKPGFVVYNDLTLTNQLCLRDVTLVDPKWLIEAAPDYFKSKHLRIV